MTWKRGVTLQHMQLDQFTVQETSQTKSYVVNYIAGEKFK